MKSLHDDIGGMMKKMAADNGVGSQLADAQDYARNYYADWRDPEASPRVQGGIKAARLNPATSIGHFQGGSDQSGIGTLAKIQPRNWRIVSEHHSRLPASRPAPISSKPLRRKAGLCAGTVDEPPQFTPTSRPSAQRTSKRPKRMHS